jgi:predicted site-specific integrase-resolvase
MGRRNSQMLLHRPVELSAVTVKCHIVDEIAVSIQPQQNTLMRIGIYARVSTKDQSSELQLRDLRAYCLARQFDLIREYIDVRQSGATDSRPQLNILMGGRP